MVFASDHGESLWEHQALPGHQYGLYDPVVRVPLGVRDPSCPACSGEVRPGPVDLVQVAATLRHLAGVAAKPGDRSLLVDGPVDHVVVGPSPIGRPGGGPGIQAAARVAGVKVIVDSWGRVERYLLEGDPGEHHPLLLAAEQQALAHDLTALAEAWAEGRPAPGALPMALGAPLDADVLGALQQPGMLGQTLPNDQMEVFAVAEGRARRALAAAEAHQDTGSVEAAGGTRALEALGYLQGPGVE